jgi:hypothetical protein
VEEKVSEESLKVSKSVEILKAETSEKITSVEDKVREEFTNQSKTLGNLKTLIIVMLASSITVIIIGIIALLR